MDDWRLFHQEEYLQGATLTKAVFKASGRNDHTHCEFCWAKFSEYVGALHEGYCTLDRYYWICGECYRDFREQFEWVLVEE